MLASTQISRRIISSKIIIFCAAILPVLQLCNCNLPIDLRQLSHRERVGWNKAKLVLFGQSYL